MRFSKPSAICAVTLASLSYPCSAFDEPTHMTLTRASVARSVLQTDPTLLTGFGLPAVGGGGYPAFSRGAVTGYQSATETAAKGSFEEDNYSGYSSSFTHFFDPQANGGAGRGLTDPLLPVAGFSSPQATSLAWMTNAPPMVGQSYSFRQGQQRLLNALVSSQPDYRLSEFGYMFQTLGHLAHHIQDMAQPQHVRNESHVHIPNRFNQASSFFEIYTTRYVNPTLASNLGVWPAVSIPAFASVQQYWTGGPAAYTGMADVTAKNFITYATGFRAITTGNTVTITANPEFPQPNGVTPTAYTYEPRVVTLQSKSTDQPVQGVVNYLVGAVRDDFGGNRQGVRIAAETQIDQLIADSLGRSRYFGVEDIDVLNDLYRINLPRAVAFGAGVINHFFRARVGLAYVSNTTWRISNASGYPMDGIWTIYFESTAGVRSSTGKSVTIALPAGGSTTIDLPFATQPAKLVAVFQGKVGAEFEMVGGVVVSYVAPPAPPPPPPPPTCLGPFKYAGNAGTLGGSGTFTFSGMAGLNYKDYVMQMGPVAGDISFNGYSTVAYQNSGMIIYANNPSKTYLGTASFTSWGAAFGPYATGVSGIISGFNPSTQGTNSIVLRLFSTGTVPSSSELTMGLSCPGGAVSDLTKGYASFYVDGASITCHSEFDFQLDGGPMKTIASGSAGIGSIPLMLGTHFVRVNALRTSGICSGTNSSWGIIKYSNKGVVQTINPGIPGTQTIVVQ